MSKGQITETETLDEKIKRIRKKNEEIEKRRLEVEADKQIAAKLNAMVQLSAPPKEDWPLPRSHSPDEDKGRMPSNSLHDKSKERTRGTVTFEDETRRPPPDPVYRFLADSERDPLPSKTPDRSRHARGRGHGMTRGRDQKGRHEGPTSGRGTPVYEAWRAERNRIDEERIRRQRTAQGQWRREWDSQKSEEDWQASRREKTGDPNNPTPNRSSYSNIQTEPILKGIVKSRTFPEENKVSLERGKARMEDADISSPIDQTLKVHVLANENRNVQNHGNSLHIAFVNESSVNKALPTASRKPVVGSGRVGLPPPKPQKKPPASASSDPASSGAGAALPQRRHRESRPQRRRFAAASTSGAATAATVRGRKRAEGPPRGRLSSGDGDDSWEDADDHSDVDAQPPARAESAEERRVESSVATGAEENARDTANVAREPTKDSDVAGSSAKSQGDLKSDFEDDAGEKQIEDGTTREQIVPTNAPPNLGHNDERHEIQKDDIVSTSRGAICVSEDFLANPSKELEQFSDNSHSDRNVDLDAQSQPISSTSAIETEELKNTTYNPSDDNVDLLSTETSLKEMEDFKSNNVAFDVRSEDEFEISSPTGKKTSTLAENCCEIQDVAETVEGGESMLTDNTCLDITDKNDNIENDTAVEADEMRENVVSNNYEVHPTPSTVSDNIESNCTAKNLDCINETVETTFIKDDNESSCSVLENKVVDSVPHLEDFIKKTNANENSFCSPLIEQNVHSNLSIETKNDSIEVSAEHEGDIKASTDCCEIKTDFKLLEIKRDVVQACKDETTLNTDMNDGNHVPNTSKEVNSSIQ